MPDWFNFGGTPSGGGVTHPTPPGRTTMRSGPRTTMRSNPRYNTSSSRTRSSYSPPPSAPSGPPVSGPGPVPDINAFLSGDPTYQGQLRDFANALSQFNADITRRRGILDTDYATSQKAMNDQKVQDLNNLQDDYGARGLLMSGLYGKAVGDYNNEFNTRMTDLGTRNTQAIDQLNQEKGRFTSQQNLQSQAAREDAIRRRAAQYGV